MTTTDQQHYDLITKALSGYRGDNLERAKAAWKSRIRSKQRMAEEWGQSGQTCQEILDSYQGHVDNVEAAQKWLGRALLAKTLNKLGERP